MRNLEIVSMFWNLGENFIMKGPQLTEQQPWLHEALSIADLIAALCLLTQTRPCPAWELFLCGNQITSYLLPFHHIQIRLVG